MDYVMKRENVLRELDLSLKELGEYTVNVLGHEFVCHREVFSPKYFRSTGIINSGFPFKSNEDFLEIGPGIGVTSILAAKLHRNRVVAVDVNPVAVGVCRKNAELHGVRDRVDVREGDVFSPISEASQFDTVFWDLPFVYLPENATLDSMLDRAFFDPGYANLGRFLQQCPSFLREEGRVIVGFGTNGDLKKFQAIAANLGFRFREVFRGSITDRGGLTYMLLESPVPADAGRLVAG